MSSGPAAQPPAEPGSPPDDDSAVEEVSAPSLAGRLAQRRTLVSFAVGFGLLFIAFQRLNVDAAATWDTVRGANLGLYVVALVVYYVSIFIRSVRWRTLLRNVGFRRSEGVSLPPLRGLARILLLGWFVNCLVPAKLGDAYRAYLLKRDADVSFSKTFGTVLAERILDLVVLFALLGVAAWLAFGVALPTAVLSLVEVALGLAVLLLVGLAGMRLLGGRIRGWLPLRLQGKYGLFEEGTLRSFRGLPLLAVETTLIWVCEGARLWLVLVALGVPQVYPAVPLFVSLAGALLTTIPITPGGLGFVESGLVGLLLLAGGLDLIDGMTPELALSVALLDRSISYASIVIFGGILHFWSESR
jgi:glycosyltransferase 2 family protein